MISAASTWLARVLVALSAVVALAGGGYAIQYARAWNAGLVDRAIERDKPFHTAAFGAVVARIRATVPADAKVLLEPSTLEQSGATTQWRWHLYLNDALAPIQCFTRQPAMASGTLVDYPFWLQHHFPAMKLPLMEGQEPRTNTLAGKTREEIAALEARAIDERGIGWRVRYPQRAHALSGPGALEAIEVSRRVGAGWERVELAPPATTAPGSGSTGAAALAALATALCAWLGGHALLFLARVPMRSRLEGHATALGVGLALAPALALAYAWLVGPISAAPGRALLAALALAGAPALWRNQRAWPAAARAGRGWWAAAAVPLAFVGFATFVCASTPMLSFDAVFHFAYKGKLLFHEGLGTTGWTDLSESVGRIVTHPGYPPGLGALAALASAVGGEFDARPARMLMPLYLAVGAAWIGSALIGRSRWAALVATTLATALPILYFTWRWRFDPFWPGYFLMWRDDGVQPGASQQLDGTGDFPLAVLLAGALLFATRALRSEPASARGHAIVAGALLGGALLVKNEGLALAGLLAFALAAAWWLARRLGARSLGPPGAAALRLAPALGVALLFALPWFAGRGDIPAVDEDYPALFTRERLARAVASGRSAEIWEAYGRSFASIARWSGTWIAFGASLLVLVLRRGLREIDAVAAALIVLGGLALYYAILLVTPWNLELLSLTGIPDRLFVHLAPLAIWSACAAGWPEREAP